MMRRTHSGCQRRFVPSRRYVAARAAGRDPRPDVAHVMSILTDESLRLKAVRRYQVLDTPPDGAFGRITSLVRASSTPQSRS